jgi:VWFA-related protein
MLKRSFHVPARRALLLAALFALASTFAPAERARGIVSQRAELVRDDFVSVELPATNEVRIENQRGGVTLEVWNETYLAVATVADGATLPADTESPVRLDRADTLLSITVPREATLHTATPARAQTSARATSSRATNARRAQSRARGVSHVATSITLVVRVPAQARVQVFTSGGAVEARGLPARLEVQTVAGDVRLSLPAMADADIMARTLDGSITVGAGMGADSGRTLRERYSARLGAGARLVRLSTVRGSIDLETGAEFAKSQDATNDRSAATSNATDAQRPRARASLPAESARLPEGALRPPKMNDSPSGQNQRARPPVLVGANDAATQRPAPMPTPNAPIEVGEDDVLTVDTSVVTLNFSVVDRKSGRGLTNLIGGDFKVSEDGVEQQITHFEQTNAPFDLLLLLDLSGSTAHVTDLIRASALRFVNTVRPDDRIAVVTFAAAPRVVSPLTADKQDLRARLAQIAPPQGDTKLYDAINYSLDYLNANSPKARRRAVVLLTDGMDSALPNVTGEGSKLDYAELRRRVEEFDGLFYAVMTDNYEEPQSPLDVQPETYDLAWDRMEELTKVAGGLYYEADKLEDVSDIYARVVEDLGTVYSISYVPTNKARDGRWRTIRVRLPRRPEAIARGKSGYYAK